MSILVKKDQGKAVEPRPEWQPFRMMKDLLRWDPFGEMVPVMALDERLGVFNPTFEIKETKEGFVFKADLPGVEEKDLEITIAGNRLSVGGKREAEREDKNDRYYTFERAYGAFDRSFTLPEGADVEHIAASLDRGVLTVVVPKRAEIQPKKIALKVGEKT